MDTSATIDAALVLATLLTLVLVALSVLVHYEALSLLNRGVHKLRSARLGLVSTMFGLLAAHIVEIWLFGVGYRIAIWAELGSLEPLVVSWADASYYSAMVYTTVGFGDVIPTHGLRMMTSGEAITGLSLITWSASFAFLQMQRVWHPPKD